MVCFGMLWDFNKTPWYTEKFQTFQSKLILSQTLPLICKLGPTLILKNKRIQNLVKIVFYIMLWYAMVLYENWEPMILYAMVWDSNAMEWDFNAMLCCAMTYVVKDMPDLTVIRTRVTKGGVLNSLLYPNFNIKLLKDCKFTFVLALCSLSTEQ